MRHFSQVVIVESQLQSGTQDDAKQALSLAIQTSKKLIPTIERTSAPRCSMNAAVSSQRIFRYHLQFGIVSLTLQAGMSFHYIIEQNVCFMTIVESNFSSKVAFHYLDDLQKEFWQSHGEHFRSVNNDRLRPFHLQNKFDRFVEKTKSVYLDSRSSQHLAKLNEDLSSTVDVMKTTVDEMMRRGTSLDGLSKTSSDIVAGSRQFKSSAQELEFALKLKQFAPVALMIFLILLLVYMVLASFLFSLAGGTDSNFSFSAGV
jgi:vesicle transport protein SEC22